jgi:hypothetical protein
MMTIQTGLKGLTDTVFFAVLFVTIVYVLSDAVGVLVLGRDVGKVLVRLFVIGAPISLFLSLVSLFSLNLARYKWYSFVSGVEVLILAVVYWIIYASQI